MNKRTYLIPFSFLFTLLIIICFRLFPEISPEVSNSSSLWNGINFCSSLIGLFFLGKFLRHYFKPLIIIITLLLLLLGTNLFIYSTSIYEFLHPISFLLLSWLLYKVSIFSFKNNAADKLIELSLIYALIVFINPIHAIFGIAALSFKLQGVAHLKRRILNLFSIDTFWLSVALFGAVQLILLALNLSFYNSFFPFLLDDQQYFFNSPHVYAALLEYRKGWLIYTPLMFFAILGFFPFYKIKFAGKLFFFSSIIVFVSAIYIHFSWWNWWYGDSFGQRVMIDYYPLLSIPLAAIVHSVVSSKSRIFKFWGAFGAAFFIYLNLFQTFQYNSGLLAKEGMSEELFWMMFGEKEKPSIHDCLLESPDYNLAKTKGKIAIKEADCNGIVVKAAKLKKYQPTGTYYGIDEAIMFTKQTPVSIYYNTPQRPSRFSVSLDENDTYLIEFYLKGELVEKVTLSNDENQSGLYAYERKIDIPGTDRVIVTAIDGDHVLSIGHFFFR